MDDETRSWLEHPEVLWSSDWTQVIPRQSMSRVQQANALARLGIVGGGLAILFRSFTFVGLGMLLLLLSRQILDSRKPTPRTQTRTDQATVAPTRPMVEEDQLEYPREINPDNASSGSSNMSQGGWAEFFTGSTGAHARQSLDFEQVQPFATFPETVGEPVKSQGSSPGVYDEQLVPPEDVADFQSGNYTLRSPFPRPITAGDAPDHARARATVGPWSGSSPFQAGFPTQYGPQPTATPLTGGQFVRNDFPEMQHQATVAMHDIHAYQPSTPQTWGAFISDGGSTSTPITPPAPSGTVGSNFPIGGEYTPRNLAAAGPPLTPPAVAGCFPPSPENPLGNVPLASNRVARPQLCPPQDPRDDSTKFIDGLYESTASQAAGYNFFQFPVQDLVDGREQFQQWVLKDGQTHFKDKYSGRENVGIYNIVDHAGDQLGF